MTTQPLCDRQPRTHNRRFPCCSLCSPVVFSLLLSCSGSVPKDFVSSAVVEAQTFQIATTIGGTITALYKEEGQSVKIGELVAVVDTIPLLFKRDALRAGLGELENNIAAKQNEIASQESDIKGIEREFNRSSSLVEQGSVPQQQKDNLETQLASAKLRLSSNRSLLAGFLQKAEGIKVQLAEVQDNIRRCHVLAPSGGTILTKYKNLGEVLLPGNPIFEMGRYDTMQVDFFVPQTILADFKLGQIVRLRLDTGNKKEQVFAPAHVSWISQDAEFSPKNIQTRESRNELVFKIRAMAANPEGALKRGLPVEVWR